MFVEAGKTSVPQLDVFQIKESARLVLGLGQGCIELRVPGKKNGSAQERQSYVGYYDDPDAFTRDAQRFHAKRQVYFGLNRRKAELLHALAAPNKVHASGEAGAVGDVLVRETFPVDVDSIRPSTKIAASAGELEAALAVRDRILVELHSRGIQPIVGMSGNGGHLLIRTVPYALDRGEDGKDGRVAVLLRYFNRMFGNEAAQVDVGNFDPARIWKTYGTAAVKGGNTTERPWRTAMAEFPAALPEPVDILALYAAEIADQRGYESRQSKSNDAPAPGDWRSKFTGNLRTLDIVKLAKETEAYFRINGGKKHAVRCPNEDAHTSGTQGDGSTIIFEADLNGWPGFHCSHSHCVGKVGLREFLEEAGPAAVDACCSEHIRKPQTKPKLQSFDFITLEDLMKRPPQKVNWLVEKMLPMGGTSIVAAKPKVGKSTLLRQMAMNVSRGESFLGYSTTQGSVLILSVEEKIDEMKKHFMDMGANGTEPIFIHASRAPEDALPLLRKEIDRVRPALVIIDTLFKVIRVQDSNDYAVVTTALEPVQDLARETGAHILSVHHMGKGERDGGDGILGSTAIFGAFDTAVLLNRKEQKRTFQTVQRYGTDVEETELVFDSERRTASLGSTKVESDAGRVEADILQYLSGQKDAVQEKEIHSYVTGNRQRKLRALRDLVMKGVVVRSGSGKRNEPFLYAIAKELKLFGL